MVVVFLAFVVSTDRTIKMIGLGMATAIAVDALVVRTVLVPAIMHTLGDLNWRLPRWLNRRLPHLDIEGEVVTRPVEEEVPIPA
jgi:RND superfamily putative drug exporter